LFVLVVVSDEHCQLDQCLSRDGRHGNATTVVDKVLMTSLINVNFLARQSLT